MNNTAGYTEEQNDALKELLNIAMGQAADSLARALGAYVQISVPRIDVIEAQQLSETLKGINLYDDKVIGIRQAFFSDLNGEAIAIFGSHDCDQVADLMGYDELDDIEGQELLLDIANVLIGACMTGFGRQIDANIGFSPPKIMAENVVLDKLFADENPLWDNSLMMEIHFGLADRSFMCELVFFMSGDSIEKVRNTIDQFLDSL